MTYSASDEKRQQQEQDLELKIAVFLRYGVIVSGLLMAAGWFLMFEPTKNPLLAFATYQAQPLEQSWHSAVLSRNWGEVLSYAGLVVLISLPTLRVFLTAILFVRSRDYLLSAIACFVLVALVTSFLFGLEL